MLSTTNLISICKQSSFPRYITSEGQNNRQEEKSQQPRPIYI